MTWIILGLAALFFWRFTFAVAGLSLMVVVGYVALGAISQSDPLWAAVALLLGGGALLLATPLLERIGR